MTTNSKTDLIRGQKVSELLSDTRQNGMKSNLNEIAQSSKKEKYKTAANDALATIEVYKGEIADLEGKVTDFKTQLEAANKAKAAAEAKVKGLESKVTELESKVTELESQLEEANKVKKLAIKAKTEAEQKLFEVIAAFMNKTVEEISQAKLYKNKTLAAMSSSEVGEFAKTLMQDFAAKLEAAAKAQQKAESERDAAKAQIQEDAETIRNLKGQLKTANQAKDAAVAEKNEGRTNIILALLSGKTRETLEAEEFEVNKNKPEGSEQKTIYQMTEEEFKVFYKEKLNEKIAAEVTKAAAKDEAPDASSKDRTGEASRTWSQYFAACGKNVKSYMNYNTLMYTIALVGGAVAIDLGVAYCTGRASYTYFTAEKTAGAAYSLANAVGLVSLVAAGMERFGLGSSMARD